MKKNAFIILLCFVALSTSAQYVDLGLPSGTKWKTTNESGFYSYEQTESKFESYLPSKKQWEELIDYCEWTWTGRGYKLIGPNGRSIFLPAEGFSYYEQGKTIASGEYGFYYSSTRGYDKYIWVLSFEKTGTPVMDTTDDIDYKAFSTRLVQ